MTIAPPEIRSGSRYCRLSLPDTRTVDRPWGYELVCIGHALLLLGDDESGWELVQPVAAASGAFTSIGWHWDTDSAVAAVLRRLVGCPW